MKELNIVQKVLFGFHSCILIIILMFGAALLLTCLFLFTGSVVFLSIIPLWYGLDYYKNQTFKSLGYKVEAPIYKHPKNKEEDASESDRLEE